MNTKPILLVIDYFKNINRKIKDNLLPADTGTMARNIRYDSEYGSIERRLSRANYNSVSFTPTLFKGIHRYYKNSTNSAALVFGLNGRIKVGYDDSGIASDLKTGLSTQPLSFQTYKDLEYIFNGSDSNVVYTLVSKTSHVENMGVPSLVKPVGTLSVATGNISGSVNYAVSLQLDGYQEGNVSPSSVAVEGQGSQITVAIPNSSNLRATGRYIYRTQSGATTLYRLATISDNTTTTYVDNIIDTSLDTTIRGPINYGVPASYKYVCLHKERVFLAWNKTYKSRIIFSDIRSGSSYPDVFPANNYLNIARDDGDELSAIKEDQFGHLTVFKENSVRIVNTSADSPISWNISDSLSNQGCVAPYSATTTPAGIIYLTRYGQNKKRLVLWNGSQTVLIPQLEGIEPDLSAIPDTALEDVKGHYHNGFFYLAYRDARGIGLYPNRVLVVDIYNNWATSIDDKNVACFASWNGGNDWGELYTGSSDNSGFIYREDTTSYDYLIRYKSEIEGGVESQTATVGSEISPSVVLTSAISDDIGAKAWAGMKGTGTTWADLTAYNDTWWLSGEWYSTIGDISAKALGSVFWNKGAGSNADVALYIRTGDTVAAVEAAGWSGPYTTSSGSDISGVAAYKYIQVKAKLLTKDYASISNAVLYRQGTTETDFAIKISANFGTPAEATIEFDWESGRIDLGQINQVYKRLRKRLISVRVEHEAADEDGSYDFRWYFNGSDTQRGSFNTSYITYSQIRTFNFPINSFCDDFIYRIYSNTDVSLLKIRKIIFTIAVLPYKPLRKNY